MAYSMLIFILSTLWHFTPVPPEVLSPAPHGFFQYYGFEQNDSEKIAPILNLLLTGADKVEEENDDHSSRKDTTLYRIYLNGDTVALEEQRVNDGTPGSKFVEKFSHKGKLLRRFSEPKFSTLAYYNSQGSWVEYKHLRPIGYNHWLDTTILKKEIKYDKLGRPIEIDEFDEHEEFMDYRKVAQKTVYYYGKNGSEIEELYFQRKLIEHPRGSRQQLQSAEEQANYEKGFQEYKQKKLFGPVEYLLYTREIRKIDSAARTIETERSEYNNGDTSIVTWTNDLTYFDKNWHPIKKNIKKKYPVGSEISESNIEYVRDERDLLLRKITHRDGAKDEVETWTYDNKGNCTSLLSWGQLEKWTYDSKGNLTEYDTGNKQKNRFKNYYR